MIRTLSILLIIVLPLMVFSQNEAKTNENKFLFGFNGGLNISKINSDTLELTNGYKPYVGVFAKYRVSDKVYIKTSVSYSIKGSTSLQPDVKIKNEYVDFNLMPQYQIFDDFYLQAGLSYSSLLSSKYITRNGKTKGSKQSQKIYDYNSELNLTAGLEFRLHDNMTFELNYAIPLEENNTSNFQLGVNISLFNRINDDQNYGRIKRKQSRKQIAQLKESVLLVRLKTSTNSINALNKIGDNKKAESIKKKQYATNKHIVKAFRENFDFCEVKFFYDNNSQNIYDNKFNNIFLNDSLQNDSSILIDKNKAIFIAEFGKLDQDTMNYFSHNTYENRDNNGLQEVHNYYSVSSEASFHALRIMDHNFIQLNKPFPYYVKVTHPIIIKWTFKETVVEMNENLNNYYFLHK